MREVDTLRFAITHEWAVVDDADIESDIVTVGISKFATDQLTDITMIELPTVGMKVMLRDAIAAVETVKSVSDIYTPVSGEIVEINSALERDPSMLSDPYGDGWLFKVRPDDDTQLDALMSHADYQKTIKK